MYVSDSKVEEAIKVFKSHGGIMRTKEVKTEGIHERVLYHLRDQGLVIHLERGVYQLEEGRVLGNPDLLVIAKKIPKARVCLISALAIHNLTDEIPHVIHLALPPSSWEPSLDYPPIKVYRFSKETYQRGIRTHTIDGIKIKVFSPAKTVADCFKFRNQIGLSIAIEALKRTLTEKKATVKEILEYARLCRVEKVMKPYLEAMTHG